MRVMFCSNSYSSSLSVTTLLIALLAVVLLSLSSEEIHGFELNIPTYSRDDFPPNFVFGSGTSSYQVEGAAAEDGRTPSIWDTFANSEKSMDTGKIACDQYHKYKEDVQLMVDTGLDAYRFSISWSRLIPNGTGHVNPKGLQYYNNLINELISHGIQPHVTLFHYDLPQILEDNYGGWLNKKIVKDFTSYADVCFKEFGDRVSHWTTVNEANVFVLEGYDIGDFPPIHCSAPFGSNCTSGNSSSEPYTVAHNILLAHASVVRLYRRKHKANQHGYVGINLFAYWFVPLTNTTKDVMATQRANDFYIGWFIDPLVLGKYPDIIEKNAGSRLTSFTKDEADQVKGSFDFIGLNHYMTVPVKDNLDSLNASLRDVQADMALEIIGGTDIPEKFPIKSEGMQRLLEYFKQNYGNPPIYIQENGQVTPNTASLNDTSRVRYLDAYIGSLLDALRNGSNTRGYFTWSFLDLYELIGEYRTSFGLYYVDRNDPDLKRYPKLSAHWYSNFLKGKHINNYGIVA